MSQLIIRGVSCNPLAVIGTLKYAGVGFLVGLKAPWYVVVDQVPMVAGVATRRYEVVTSPRGMRSRGPWPKSVVASVATRIYRGIWICHCRSCRTWRDIQYRSKATAVATWIYVWYEGKREKGKKILVFMAKQRKHTQIIHFMQTIRRKKRNIRKNGQTILQNSKNGQTITTTQKDRLENSINQVNAP